MNRQLLALCLSVLVTLFISGCGDTRVTFQLQGLHPLNLNDQNESTAVRVVFYQLKHKDRFLTAPVDSIWTNDQKALGDDIIDKPTYQTVTPGSSSDTPITFVIDKVDPNTKFIGVLALFSKSDIPDTSKSDGSDTRVLILPLSSAGDKVLEFKGFTVRLQSDTPPPPEKTADDGKTSAPAKGR